MTAFAAFLPVLRLARALLCGGLLLLLTGHANGMETVTLQLKWSHAFQFAGYYAAKEKGYYRDIGLDVYFREAGPGVDPMEQVLAGRAQFGVGTSSLLLARKAGKPVVVLAVVFQHSPLVLVARQMKGQQGSQTIHDLLGRRLMIEPQSDELIAYLKQEGITSDRLQLEHHSLNPRDLIEGRVDAMSAYSTSEPYYLEQAGIPYQVYTPRSAGIDFYGDNLFTTESELKLHPERVRAFREASLRGWHYAMEHPEEIADLIRDKYSVRHPRDFFLYEARHMVPLLRTDLIDVGYMTAGRWRHIVDTYADLGLLPRNYSLDGFLYDSRETAQPAWLPLGLTALVVVLGLALYFFRLRRALSSSQLAAAQALARMRNHEFLDPQTGLPGRLLLKDRLNGRLVDMRRYGGRGALIFLRLADAGDAQAAQCAGANHLPAFAASLSPWLRDTDTLARLGEAQLVVLLGRLEGDDEQVLQRVRGVEARIVECYRRLSGADAQAAAMPALQIDRMLLDAATSASEILS